MNPPQDAEPAPGGAKALAPQSATAGGLGWTVTAVGVVILAGWIADLPVLRSLLPGQVETKVNTALGFVFAGIALGLKSRGRGGWLAGGCAALAAAIGLATLLQYLLGSNWGIDELVMRDVSGAVDTVHPGRMAPPTALNFILGGVALLLLQTRRSHAAAWLGFAVCGVAGLGFVGNLYGVPELLSFGPYTAMATPTGITFLLLGAGLLQASAPRLEARVRRWAMTGGFLGALLLLALLAGAVVRNARLLMENNRRVIHAHEVLDRLGALRSAMQDVETGTRGYLLTGDRAFLEPALHAPASARDLLAELRRLAPGGGPSAPLQRLDELVGAKVEVSMRQTALRGEGDAARAQQLVAGGEGRRLMDEIREVIGAWEAEELRLLRERQARAELSTSKTLMALGMGLTVSLALLVAVFVLLRREIALRVRLAAQLRHSEESLAVTLYSIGDGVLATDTQGRITLLNPVAEQLTGWPLADARGRPVAEVFNIVNEQTRAPAAIPVEKVLATGEIQGLANHTALIARDGTERAIADSAAPIRDQEGRIRGVVLVFRDVTESRRAQAQLDRFFELSLDFLCIASDDGYFKRVSPAVTDILGWSVEEFLAMPYLEQVHPDDRAATEREVERQMTTGAKVLQFENRYRHKDGSWRVLSWRSVPQNGFMYATARDVTEARRAEEQIHALNHMLRRHAAQLETANQELESFSYSVSHDLRAPLRHVQGYVEMLKRESQDALSEKAQRYLRTIAEAAREMGDLIDDLLTFSRMGRSEMRETEVDLAALLDEVRRGLEPETADRDIRWTIRPLPRVRADVAMLRQVLVNLVGNAVKYTRRRAPAEIEVGCGGQEEGRLVFYVRDNGAGFDMKYADKLFGVFQRLHRADEFEGTGIGLASVRRIIGRHGGRTWAEARLEAGATFYFTLQPVPAVQPPIPAAP